MEELKANVSDAAYNNIQSWLTEPKYELYRSELLHHIESQEWQFLEDSFFKIIEFGTGGRRGTTGIGSNRINKVTIGESAQALCSYALKFDADAASKGVAIAYDTRISSEELSKFTAEVCAANGFKVYIFESFRSTPELSFAVRHLGCAIGIVISASHNPPADNGFKPYWSDGGQLVSPHDKGVLSEAASIDRIKTMSFDEGISTGKITTTGSEVDEAYVAAAVKEVEGKSRDVSIVYSPLHGAGSTNTLPILREAGFNNIETVDSQMVPDGNFPTIENGKANPEEPGANDLAVAAMMASGADIAVTNDPDADRIGVMVNHQGSPVYLNGNQSAVLATEYVLRKKYEKGELTPKHYIAKTIVTTDMLCALADTYNVRTYGNMLIGFKYIGALIHAKENTDEIFVIGGEESYGLLKGTYTRDKDGAIGAVPLAEYAAELKSQGKTLIDRLFELYKEHGVYAEQLTTAYCLGAKGFEQMKETMVRLRQSPPSDVNGEKVTAVLDYAALIKKNVATGEETSIDCLSGDVVVLEFGDERRRVTVRPSGTEPKLKFYIQWFDEAGEDVFTQYKSIEAHMKGVAAALEGTIKPS
jgi:phosphoglucomutase